MIYLDSIMFPSQDDEWNYRVSAVKRTCYNTLYPFYVLSEAGLNRLDFEDITILYGGNGSGKTTALNVIAEKLSIQRGTPYLTFLRIMSACARCGWSSPYRLPAEF